MNELEGWINAKLERPKLGEKIEVYSIWAERDGINPRIVTIYDPTRPIFLPGYKDYYPITHWRRVN